MNTLQKKFKCDVGFSDHSDGYIASCLAVSMGAKIIEKHFTINRNLPGPTTMSLNPNELKKFVKKIRDTELMLGTENKIICKDEKDMIKVARRGVISIKKIKKGDTFNKQNIAIKRPCLGLGADKINEIIGKKSLRNIDEDTPVTISMIKR